MKEREERETRERRKRREKKRIQKRERRDVKERKERRDRGDRTDRRNRTDKRNRTEENEEREDVLEVWAIAVRRPVGIYPLTKIIFLVTYNYSSLTLHINQVFIYHALGSLSLSVSLGSSDIHVSDQEQCFRKLSTMSFES